MKRNLFVMLVAMFAVVSAAFASTSTEEKAKTINLTKAQFEAKVADLDAEKWKYLGDKPAIVDFYADWCPPCKRIAPILDELAKEYDGEIVIYKVDTDKEKEIAAAFGIRSLPTLLFIPAKGDPQLKVGAMDKEGFVKQINETLLNK